MSAKTYNGKTYYTIPCYGDSGFNGTPVQVSGMPVDTIVFTNSSTYYYELGLYPTQRVFVYSLNNMNNNTYLYVNGTERTISGGSGMSIQKLPTGWFAPILTTSAPGAGQLVAGEKDNDW